MEWFGFWIAVATYIAFSAIEDIVDRWIDAHYGEKEE